MVIVNFRTSGTPNAADRAAIVNFVGAGGLLIFHTWDVWLWPGDPILALMDVTYVSDYTTPPSMFIWEPTHPTTTTPNLIGDLPVNLALDAWNRDGQRVDAIGGGLAVAGHVAGPGVTAGQGAVIVNANCTTHFQGAAVDCYDADLDLDGRADIEEFAENEIVALLTGCIPSNRPLNVIFRVTVDDGTDSNTCTSVPFDLVDPPPCIHTIYGDLTGFGVRTDSGSTAGRADETQPGCGPAGASGEVIYSFTPPLSGMYTVDTIGSSFDTVLTLRTDCDDPATEIACDDNGGGGGDSLIAPVLVAGTEYFIAVDGAAGAEGAYMITITPPPPPSCTIEEVLPGAVPITRFGNISGADETYAPSCAGGGGLDHVYEFTPAVTGNYDISLCGGGTNYDSVLGLWDADCFTGVELACSNDVCGQASAITNFPLVAGTTYYILVDGFLGLEGDYQLDIDLTPPPCSFGAGTSSCFGTVEGVLNGVLPIVVMGDTTGADNTVFPSCATGGPDHVFEFTPAVSGNYRFSLCGGGTAFDSVIDIRRGNCSLGSVVGCNDNACGLQSELTVALVTGTGTYYVVIDGATAADFGPYELTITCQ